MIFEFLVRLALDVSQFLLGLLPEVEVDIPALAPAFSLMLTFDAFLPLHEMLAGALLLVAVTGLLFVFKLIQTVVAHVPGIGGGGA